MAAVIETLEEEKHEKETIEKEAAEGMDVDKQDEEVKEKVGKKVEDGGVGKEEEAKSDDAISPKTPGSRPTRERKTVERYFESLVVRGSATKPLSIEKGQGMQLKDIPNVAYKLSKRKPDDNLQMLHSILFGKKTKAHNLKKNIGLFSGYVWVENEEKQRAKIKERLDKCVKEKLLSFCDVLNIPVSRSAAKKDELSVKLLEFLESPHSTTDSLLVEKEQKSKKRKSRGKTSKKTGSLDQAAGKSAKKLQKAEGEKRKRSPKIEDESDDEPSSARDESGDDNDDEEANEVGSDHEESVSEKEEDEEPEEEKPKKKKSNGNVPSKKDSGNKATEKAKAVKKDNPAKSPKSSTKSTKVSSSKASKRVASEADSLVTPKKQKVEKKSQKEEKESVKENASNKKKSSKSTGNEKSGKKAKAEPSNEEIHAAVVNILKEVDFNSATLSDIIRNLGSLFGVDLMHRKAEVKAVITDVINNMSDEEEGDDPEAENDEEKTEEDDVGNDEEKNEGDDAEAENDDEKNEGDGPDAETDGEKNEGDA